MPDTKPINVLFLCTGNSARSILSEALLNDLGSPKFKAFSAGSKPSGVPHPEGLNCLRERGHDVEGYRSKSWDEFGKDDAPIMDIIVTVCGSAAEETCPVWPHWLGNPPIAVHWGMDDPAYIEPLEARREAFASVYEVAKSRVEALIDLHDAQRATKRTLQGISEI